MSVFKFKVIKCFDQKRTDWNESATVRKDGSIFFKGMSYNSPSTAAQAITNRAMNGWATWSYERAPGDWVLLDVLRKK